MSVLLKDPATLCYVRVHKGVGSVVQCSLIANKEKATRFDDRDLKMIEEGVYEDMGIKFDKICDYTYNPAVGSLKKPTVLIQEIQE